MSGIDYDPGRVNREQWLTDAVNMLRPDFEAAGMTVPVNVKVSCGWSSHGARGKAANSTLGQCWSPVMSSAGNHEIFISPIVDDSQLVAATLVHELIHAAIGTDKKHGAEFGKCARKMGFKGPMKTINPTEKLIERVMKLVEINGEYPHARMGTLTSGKKKQKARMLKVACPDCGYTVRVAEKWIAEGMPTCPCGTEMTQSEGNEE